MISDWLFSTSPHINYVWVGSWKEGTLEAPRELFDHELVYFSEGTTRVKMGDTVFECEAGSYLIVPPGVKHSSLAVSGPVFRECIHFDWEYIGEIEQNQICIYSPAHVEKRLVRKAPDFVLTQIFRGKVRRPKFVRELMETLVGHYRSRRTDGKFLARTYLERAIRECLYPAETVESGINVGSPVELAQQVKQMLDEMEERPASLQSVLEGLGYSYAHVCRNFTKHYGVPPLKYLTIQRLERAHVLLNNTEKTVKAIASDLHFEDTGYFIRLYKRHYGTTPGKRI
ncbi:MAG: AraC family transcriptional regulator [Verrucomicrobiota bacterium]|nr:AraC family transcriptional regulator [Verrucomicrobiota bacterium]